MNKSGARTQPCFVPFTTSKLDENSPFSTTIAVIPSWKERMIVTHTHTHTHTHIFQVFSCHFYCEYTCFVHTYLASSLVITSVNNLGIRRISDVVRDSQHSSFECVFNKPFRLRCCFCVVNCTLAIMCFAHCFTCIQPSAVRDPIYDTPAPSVGNLVSQLVATTDRHGGSVQVAYTHLVAAACLPHLITFITFCSPLFSLYSVIYRFGCRHLVLFSKVRV